MYCTAAVLQHRPAIELVYSFDFCFLGRDMCSSFVILHRYCPTLVLHGTFGDHPLPWGVCTTFHVFTLASLFSSLISCCSLLFHRMWIYQQLPRMNCISTSSESYWNTFSRSVSYSSFDEKPFRLSVYRRWLTWWRLHCAHRLGYWS